MLSSSRPRSLRKLFLLLLVAVVGWLVYNLVRSRVLLGHGAVIAQQGDRFPRDYFVGDADKPVIKYLVLGDSTAAGWGAGRLEDTYPYQIASAAAKRGYRVHVRNVAVGGAKIWDVCRGQLPALSTVHPDLVSLTVGTNDATQSTDDGACIRGYRNIFTALRQSGARTILVASLPDMYQVPALPQPVSRMVGHRAQRINVLLMGEASNQRINVLDLWSQGKLIYRKDPNLYAADLFHPSGKGYRMWAKVFIKALAGKL